MILNRYEESTIKNSVLPPSWQSERILDELNEFLQQNWNQRAIFYDDEKYDTHQQFLGFTDHKGIRTKKYIGTISYAGEQLNIFPKMFREDLNDNETDDLSLNHLMKNLIRWIEYCNKVSYPFIHISTELSEATDLRELFITLYLSYVKAAIERGLYYRYVEETEDLGYIKGKLDFKDYVLKKIPNGMGHKFRCSYSNFEFDNRVNRIIKYVCKQLINSSTKRNQAIARSILVRMNDVSDVQCKPSDCDGIHLSKMHSNYRVILGMSKMFLFNKTSGFSVDSNESFCFLFPTDLLFEGFIGGFLQETVEKAGGKVSLQKSDMHLIEDVLYAGESLGAAFTMRHDIVVEVDGKLFILDTKYKAMSRFEGESGESVKKTISDETKQSDIYQVCEYARKRGVSDVFLLYPMFRYEDNEPHFPVGKSLGPDGEIAVHFVRLPFVFENDETSVKNNLAIVIQNILGIQG